MARRTREKVRTLLEQGRPVKEIARLLGLSPGTVGYHKRRLGLPIDDKFNRRYDWGEVQRFYDRGFTVRRGGRNKPRQAAA